jgi:hypothetical protein
VFFRGRPLDFFAVCLVRAMSTDDFNAKTSR